uniref:Ig-like domain-containing protein n=1 Tax=Listeria rocourtiae TaxID=647910 RepID=UPI003D2F5987
MTKYRTMKKIAVAAIVANVAASSMITALPGEIKAAENGTQSEKSVRAGVTAVNLLKNTQFVGINNWELIGNYQTLTLSGPDETGSYFYEGDYKRYSIRAWENGQVTLGAKGDSTIMRQEVATIPGHTYKLQYKAVQTSGTMYYRVQVYGNGVKLIESSSGAVMTGGYRVSDETTQTLTFKANSTISAAGFGVVGDNHSQGTMRYSNVSLIDITTVADATLNAITTNSTVATGKGEPGGTVVIKNAAGSQIGTGTVDANGNYSVAIPKQAYNTNITATVTALEIPSSASQIVRQAPLVNTTINPITSQDTTASGTGEPGATVTFKADGKDYTTTVASDGTWRVAIPKQAKDSVVEGTATLNGVSSNTAKATVTNGGPSTPTLDNVTDKSTKVTGSADPLNDIIVKVTTDGTTISYTGKVDQAGNYSVNIDTPKAGAVVEVVAKDGSLLSDSVSKIVQDVTAPDAPDVDPVKVTDTKITGTGEANGDVKVTLPSGGIVNGKADKDGHFNITIPQQELGKEIQVTITDAAGNESAPTTVIVKADDNILLAPPTINDYYVNDGYVSGTAPAGA